MLYGSPPTGQLQAYLSDAVFPSSGKFMVYPNAVEAGRFFHGLVPLILELAVICLIEGSEASSNTLQGGL